MENKQKYSRMRTVCAFHWIHTNPVFSPFLNEWHFVTSWLTFNHHFNVQNIILPSTHFSNQYFSPFPSSFAHQNHNLESINQSRPNCGPTSKIVAWKNVKCSQKHRKQIWGKKRNSGKCWKFPQTMQQGVPGGAFPSASSYYPNYSPFPGSPPLSGGGGGGGGPGAMGPGYGPVPSTGYPGAPPPSSPFAPGSGSPFGSYPSSSSPFGSAAFPPPGMGSSPYGPPPSYGPPGWRPLPPRTHLMAEIQTHPISMLSLIPWSETPA